MKLLFYVRVAFGIIRVHIYLKLPMFKYVKGLTKPKLH
jgi:hypothetical protein